VRQQLHGASEMGSYDTFKQQQPEGLLLHDKKQTRYIHKIAEKSLSTNNNLKR
jgi:hypothetical protein